MREAKRPSRRTLTFVPLVLAGVLAGLAAPAAADLKAAVTIKPIHGLTARILEGIATPSLLVTGKSSPHTYALKPSDARLLNQADVFIRVGEALEPFTVRIAASLPKTVEVVTLTAAPGLTLLSRRSGGSWEAHEHGHGAGHDHGQDAGNGEKEEHGLHTNERADGHTGGVHSGETPHEDQHTNTSRDPHIWLDPGNAKAIAAHIASVLAAKSPQNAPRIRENAAKLAADIDALTAELEQDLKPLAGKPFVVFHDAYQYFERRFSLPAAGSITVSPDVAPSARRLSEIRQKILSLGAVCVFAEPYFQPQLTAAVTEGTQARTGTLDPEGLSIEPGPDAYFQLMRGLAANFKACLAGPAP